MNKEKSLGKCKECGRDVYPHMELKYLKEEFEGMPVYECEHCGHPSAPHELF